MTIPQPGKTLRFLKSEKTHENIEVNYHTGKQLLYIYNLVFTPRSVVVCVCVFIAATTLNWSDCDILHISIKVDFRC